MQKYSKYFVYLFIAIIAVVLVLVLVKTLGGDSTDSDKNGTENSQSSSNSDQDEKLNYLLSGYPIKEVPLYKLREVSSNKYFINFDPKNTSDFDETNFTYYNVVLYTEASKEEFLDYYTNFFDKVVVDEYPIPDMVKGTIGKYRVTAAHYGYDDTAYIRVYMPTSDFTKTNPYFGDYPELFEEDKLFVEAENSYGLLNQVGGQTEYTRYYTVLNSGDQDKDGKDDVDEFGILETKYQTLYKDKSEYTFDAKTGLMTWQEGEYKVSLNLTRDHGRVYLNIRGVMEK